ncbi:unnamed protein product [Protopolystoma xenopodis]|uniref:Uncharacterized protein n=1 Tax=Protopolystoma xenopodis TaxID=117903 RepID=A0A3S5FCX3_9PLAT|nr:unnamed protein product [Protopolystoma xenopodis]
MPPSPRRRKWNYEKLARDAFFNVACMLFESLLYETRAHVGGYGLFVDAAEVTWAQICSLGNLRDVSMLMNLFQVNHVGLPSTGLSEIEARESTLTNGNRSHYETPKPTAPPSACHGTSVFIALHTTR